MPDFLVLMDFMHQVNASPKILHTFREAVANTIEDHEKTFEHTPTNTTNVMMTTATTTMGSTLSSRFDSEGSDTPSSPTTLSFTDSSMKKKRSSSIFGRKMGGFRRPRSQSDGRVVEWPLKKRNSFTKKPVNRTVMTQQPPPPSSSPPSNYSHLRKELSLPTKAEVRLHNRLFPDEGREKQQDQPLSPPHLMLRSRRTSQEKKKRICEKGRVKSQGIATSS